MFTDICVDLNGLDGLHFDVSEGFGSPGIQEWRFWWHHPGGKSL